jgi:protein disulfide-isomerase A1
MRFFSSVGSAVLVGASLAAAASDVINLTSENFESTVNKESLILVEFFAPWCGHCKSLAPEYEQAATTLKDKGVPIAKVDCVDQADLCTAQGVTGYPTLKVFKSGESSTYGGPRKADGIIAYMLKQALPAVSDVTIANHDEFKTSDKVVVIAYLGSKTDAPAAAFSSVAEKHRDDYLFGISTDADALKVAGVEAPAIVVYQKFDNGRADFPAAGIKNTNVEVLEKFILDNSVALLDQVTGENYPGYAQTGLPLAYLFIDPYDEKLQEHIDAVKPIAAKYKGKINFVWIDAIKYADHAKTLNLKMDNWPGFVIQDIEGGLKFPMSGVAPSFATVDDWVSKYAAGSLEPSLKTAEIPKENDGAVKVVVGAEYNKHVLDDSKDVFVEFYAPWCGHCKRLAPTWEELGEHYSAVNDKITIAKMDATENDLPPSAPFKIAGFPTLMFKPAGSSEFLQYDGDRTLEDLIKFTQQHAKNDVTPPPKAATEEAAAAATETAESKKAEHQEL